MMVKKVEKRVDKDVNKSYQMGVKAQIGSQDTTSKTVDVNSDNVMDRKDSSFPNIFINMQQSYVQDG